MKNRIAIRAVKKRKKKNRPRKPLQPSILAIFFSGEIVHRFEQSAILRFLIILSIPAALYSLYLQYQEVSAGNLGRSWSNLTTKSSGNSGKVAALEHLSRDIKNLPNLDLSCSAMGGIEKKLNGEDECVRPTYLNSLNLFEEGMFHYSSAFMPGSNFSGVDMAWADVSHGFIDNSQFQGSSLISANFFQASAEESNFSSSIIVNANFSYAVLDGSDFSNANLYSSIFYAAHAPGANFNGANLSHVYFYGAFLEGASFDETWAWADAPPVGVEASRLCTFDSNVHNRWEKPKICLAPTKRAKPVPPVTLNHPMEEADCGIIEGIRRFLFELTNGKSSADCFKRNLSYTSAWITGSVSSKYPTKRWDQILSEHY
ncbi:pentapeptide repeat-containing protein [Rhodobacteraceae bacterium D3-12]|nr:pentapeptide repeat-containing protein [Rhodobacteraceae bacterium D3-12]